MMRFLFLCLLSFLHAWSYMLGAIGGMFSSNAQFWHISYMQLATRYDEKYSKPAAREQPRLVLLKVMEDDDSEPTSPAGRSVN